MSARMRDRVKFKRLDTTPDEYGNVTDNTFTVFLTVWGKLAPQRGRERLRLGELQSQNTAVLEIRGCTAARGVTTADVAEIGGEDYQIRSIINPDRRNHKLEMTLERGFAV